MKRQLIFSIIIVLLSIFVVFATIYVVLQEQSNQWKISNDYCDSKYGIGNWEYEDITGTNEARKIAGNFYIGQVWNCKGILEGKKK